MPLVCKTRHCQAFAVFLAVTALYAQPARSDGWKLFDSVQAGQQPAAVWGGALPAYHGDSSLGSGGLLLGGAAIPGRIGVQSLAAPAEQRRQLRLHAGYDFGPVTGFVTVGGVAEELSGGPRQAPVFGFGMRVSLNRALQLTGELLHHDAGPLAGGASPGGETLSVSAAFRF